MCKALSFYVSFKQLDTDGADPSKKLQEIMTEEYKDLDEIQRSFYTISFTFS